MALNRATKIYTKSVLLYNGLKMTNPKKSQKNFLIVTLISLFVLLADQCTKLIALKYFEKSVPVIGDFLKMEQSFNPGIAFGIPVNPRLILILSVIIVLFLIRIAATEFKFDELKTQIGFAFILSGALGNILDRLIRAEVIDFINFSFWPSFNLADLFIVVGVILLLVFYKDLSKKG
jgi:signal peptidase II